MVPQCEGFVWSLRGQTFDSSPLDDPDTDYWIVFPRDDAAPFSVDRVAPRAGRRRAFVILDGTWRQCSRMARRIEAVARRPFVALPEGAPSAWGIRKPRDAKALCTFEAAIRLMDLIEGPDAAAVLDRAFSDWVQRMLVVKGKTRRSAASVQIWDPPARG